MISIQEFSKLTSLMFAASLDQRKWVDFLEYLAGLTNVRTHMFGYDVENNMSLDLLSRSYDPEFIDSYNNYYSSLNSWAPGFFEHPVGKTISSEAMCSRRDLVKTEWYNDWVKPQEDIIAGGGAILFKEASRMFVIGGNIRRKDEHIEEDWLEIVRLLTPHLQSAIEVNRLIARNNIDQLVSGQGLNIKNTGIFIINNFGRIMFTNELASEMLEIGSMVYASHNRHLKYRDHLSDKALQKSSMHYI